MKCKYCNNQEDLINLWNGDFLNCMICDLYYLENNFNLIGIVSNFDIENDIKTSWICMEGTSYLSPKINEEYYLISNKKRGFQKTLTNFTYTTEEDYANLLHKLKENLVFL